MTAAAQKTEFRPWTYRGREILSIDDVPEGMTHFVYRITNEKNGTWYAGQKAVFMKTKWKVNSKTVIDEKTGKAKKKTKRSLRESNWLKYCGSSGQLTEDIKHYGKASFKREIIYWCEGKAVANYMELFYQLKHDALLDPKSLNGIVNVRISHNQIKNSSIVKNYLEKGIGWNEM